VRGFASRDEEDAVPALMILSTLTDHGLRPRTANPDRLIGFDTDGSVTGARTLDWPAIPGQPESFGVVVAPVGHPTTLVTAETGSRRAVRPRPLTAVGARESVKSPT
jgi:hypothetical protein